MSQSDPSPNASCTMQINTPPSKFHDQNLAIRICNQTKINDTEDNLFFFKSVSTKIQILNNQTHSSTNRTLKPYRFQNGTTSQNSQASNFRHAHITFVFRTISTVSQIKPSIRTCKPHNTHNRTQPSPKPVLNHHHGHQTQTVYKLRSKKEQPPRPVTNSNINTIQIGRKPHSTKASRRHKKNQRCSVKPNPKQESKQD